MHLRTRKQTDAGVVPLQTAVLCLDCECVSNGRCDECPVCRGHSLLSIARLLGGTLQPQNPYPQKDQSLLRFDLKISIDLKQMESKELNEAVEAIGNLIAPSLGRGQARCHINVEPVVAEAADDSSKGDGARAA